MGSRGFATLVVLWALLLLGTLALSFSFSMRTEALAARHAADGARAYFQARTAVGRAAAFLSGTPADNAAGTVLSGGDEEEGYGAVIEAESGKVDVNLAPEKLLKGVLRGAGLDEEGAEALGDAILDWRDGDDRPRARGAEAPEYASLPEPVVPRNGPLASVAELRYVRGVSPGLHDRVLARAFTVHGRLPQVNVNAVPVDVLRLLPGFTAESAQRLADRRAESPFRTPADVAAFLAAEGVPAEALALLTTASVSRTYTITAVGRAGSVVRGVRCLVEAASPGETPRVLRWEDVAAAGGDG